MAKKHYIIFLLYGGNPTVRYARDEVETEYRMRETPIKPEDYRGWKFNWSITEKNGYHIYELFLKNDDMVQGKISVKVDGGVADADIL